MRQGGGFSADFTTGNRRVEVRSACGLILSANTFGGGRRDRTHVDHDFASASAFSHTVFAEQNVFNLRGVRHHDDDEFGFLRHFAWVGQGDSAFGHQISQGFVVVFGEEQV